MPPTDAPGAPRAAAPHVHDANCVHHAAAAAVRDGAPTAVVRRLVGALVLTAGFCLVEAVGGWLANSLALIADAGHMLSDVGALGLAAGVAVWARGARDTRRVLRAEGWAALVNGVVLLVVCAGIVVEAARRLQAPEPVGHELMLGVAVVGLLVNIVAAWLLRSVAGANLNVRGAYLHVLGDLLGSVGTIVAAECVRRFGWNAADVVASLVVAALVVYASVGLIRDARRQLASG